VFVAAELLIRTSAAHADSTAAVYWQPPDAAALGADARAAFSAAVAAMGARFLDATPAEPVEHPTGEAADDLEPFGIDVEQDQLVDLDSVVADRQTLDQLRRVGATAADDGNPLSHPASDLIPRRNLDMGPSATE